MVRRGQREVVYVERGGDASVKYLLWGAVLGAGFALLYAPTKGEETRRSLQRRLWKFRAMTEEKLDEFMQQFGSQASGLRGFEEDSELEDAVDDVDAAGEAGAGSSSAREELERRLEQARARRRSAAGPEGPLA